jgi:hypothetical protein
MARNMNTKKKKRGKPRFTAISCQLLSAARPRYDLMTRNIKTVNDKSAKSNYNSSGRKTAKEPPLQGSLPKGGQLHPLGDVAPGPPQQARHHGGKGLVAARGLHRSGGAQRARSLPVGLGNGLDDDLLLFE